MRKAFAHVGLFALVVVVFYLGLGVGLQFSVPAGITLWGVALCILVLNLVWIARSRSRQ